MATGNVAARTMGRPADGIVWSRVWIIGLLAIVASIIANLVAGAILVPLLGLPADFPPFGAGPISIFTGLGVAAAVAVFALTVRFTGRPIQLFRIIAAVALVVSIIPNIALALNPSAAPIPGGTATAFVVLIVFHVVAAVVCTMMLTTLTRAPAARV